MQKLDQEIVCHECKTSHMSIPIEEEDAAPVHCSECGALMCLWGDLMDSNMLSIRKKA